MKYDSHIILAEDGEAMGTLSQFANRLNRSRSFVLRWIRSQAPRTIILNAGEGRELLLILAPSDYERLLQCTRHRPYPQRERLFEPALTNCSLPHV